MPSIWNSGCDPLWGGSEAHVYDATASPEAGFSYRAYGLRFTSDLRLSHFPEVGDDQEPDVRIRYGDIFGSNYTPPPTIQIESSPGRLLVRGARSATFLVTGGDTITIEPLPGGNPTVIRQILLGWVFAGLFHQRAMLPLHGSVLCMGDDCFIFCAPSGGGKSTLAAAFLNKGFSFLDDNLAIAEFGDGMTSIASGSPELRLWESSMADLEFNYDMAGRIRPGLDKFAIIVQPCFRNEKARLKKIFVLKKSNDSMVSFVKVTGTEKFKALLANVFCIGSIGDCGSSPSLFQQVHELARSVPVVDILLPEKLPTPDELRDMIIDAHLFLQ